ncbi:MAG: hypothetical protein L3K09_04885 [Thermoplasmata archaeon]|nr:hypothetical protein [Thermoplasmata archaeon]
MKAFQSEGAGTTWSTSDIRKRVAKLSGTKIPDQSLYGALRTLVRRRAVSSKRSGRELSFTLSTAAKPARKPTATVAEPAPAPVMIDSSTPVAMAPTTALATITSVQKLAPGEAAILHIGEAHVETATNVHGKVVLERHRRPA